MIRNKDIKMIKGQQQLKVKSENTAYDSFGHVQEIRTCGDNEK